MGGNGIVDDLIESLREGRMYLDWIGGQPHKLIGKSGSSLVMRFLKVNEHMVSFKSEITFRKSKESMSEIASILRFVLAGKTPEQMQYFYMEMPAELLDYLKEKPLFAHSNIEKEGF